MAECATIPPVFEVEYGIVPASVAGIPQGTLNEATPGTVWADVTRDPCITQIQLLAEPADWTVSDAWPSWTDCTDTRCTYLAVLGFPQAGGGRIWAVGTTADESVLVTASGFDVAAADVSPSLGWEDVNNPGVPYTGEPPDRPLRPGEAWLAVLSSAPYAHDEIVVDFVGNVPDALQVDASGGFPIEPALWHVGLDADGAGAGEWEFDVVATDEEGSVDTVTVTLEVRAGWGCRHTGRTAGLLGMVLPILATRRRRRP